MQSRVFWREGKSINLRRSEKRKRFFSSETLRQIVRQSDGQTVKQSVSVIVKEAGGKKNGLASN